MSSSRQKSVSSERPIRELFTLSRADRIEVRATDWLIGDFLALNTLAGLIGAPGTCKTFLALDWACRVATGTPWLGREVKQGAALYFAGEGQAGLRKRATGWELATGVSLVDAPLYVASALPSFCDTANISLIVETIESCLKTARVKPTLIVVDTIARAMAGANENSAEDMGCLIHGLDELRVRWGATVLTVHHVGHQASDRGRGSSSYGASLDSDFFLMSKGSEVHLKPGSKAKDWAPPPPVVLERIQVSLSGVGDGAESTLVLREAQSAIRDKAQQGSIVELRDQGLSERQIAEKLGINKSKVHRTLRGHSAMPGSAG